MRGLTRDCLAELTHRKIIWLYVIVAIMMVGAIVIAGQLKFSLGQTGSEGVDAKNFFEFRAQTVTVILW